MNMPLESKYWKLEKDLQNIKKAEWDFLNWYSCPVLEQQSLYTNIMSHTKVTKWDTAEQWSYFQFKAASSFRYSALYTRPTVERGNVSQADDMHSTINTQLSHFLYFDHVNIKPFKMSSELNKSKQSIQDLLIQ